MRFVGFWVSENSKDQWFLDCAISYTIIAVIFGTAVIWTDFYFSIGDFYVSSGNRILPHSEINNPAIFIKNRTLRTLSRTL